MYRQGPGHFDASNIDPNMCTHIVYAFAKVSYEGEMQVYDDYNDVGDEWHEGKSNQRALDVHWCDSFPQRIKIQTFIGIDL